MEINCLRIMVILSVGNSVVGIQEKILQEKTSKIVPSDFVNYCQMFDDNRDQQRVPSGNVLMQRVSTETSSNLLTRMVFNVVKLSNHLKHDNTTLERITTCVKHRNTSQVINMS